MAQSNEASHRFTNNTISGGSHVLGNVGGNTANSGHAINAGLNYGSINNHFYGTPSTGPTSAASSVRPTFLVPFPRDKRFVDRPDIFTQIEEGFDDDRPVALCGLGGVGKSQIAIEYAYRFRERHPNGHVFWVYAANVTRFSQTYQHIARRLQLRGHDDPQVDVCELLCDWLNERDDIPWLMILDNADDATQFISADTDIVTTTTTTIHRYLPTLFHTSQRLLITTRNRELGEYLSGDSACVQVGSLSQDEACDLLRRRLRPIPANQNIEMDQLVEMLGCNALAITQAAAFVNQNKMCLSDYVAELKTDQRSLMDHLTHELQDPRREQGYPNSVFRTWKLSFDQLRTHHARAAEILSLMAMLDGQKIPEDLVRTAEERSVDFWSAMGTLDGYSMITKEVGGTTCAMHPLVQASVHYFLQETGEIDLYRERALQLVTERFPRADHEHRAVCEALLPHAQAVLRYETTNNDSEKCRGNLFHKVGRFEWQQGRYSLAHINLHATYESCRTTLGKEHPDTLTSMNNLAAVLSDQGKYDAAETIHREALALREKVLGKEHPDTLMSINNLALVLSDQGKYETAETIFREVLALKEKVLGKEHPDTLTSMNNLASVLNKQGKYETAETILREVLVLLEKVLGEEHPNTLMSTNNLASVLSDQGKYETAETILREVLALKEKVLGKEHPNTLTSMNNLASVLSDQGKYEAAETIHREALALRGKVLGKEHPNTLTSINNLVSVLSYQGKYKAAETILREALALSEKVLGKEHPNTLTSMNNLALVLSDQGKYEAAETIHREELALLEKVLGKEYPNTLTSINNLALVLSEQGKYEAAETIHREALALKEKVLGEEHPSTLMTVWNSASLCYRTGSHQDSTLYYQRAITGFQKTLGHDHPRTVACEQQYARFHRPG